MESLRYRHPSATILPKTTGWLTTGWCTTGWLTIQWKMGGYTNKRKTNKSNTRKNITNRIQTKHTAPALRPWGKGVFDAID